MEIRDLVAAGLSVSEISRRLARDRKTVRAAIQRDYAALPRRRRGGVRRDVKLEPFTEYLEGRLAKGIFHLGMITALLTPAYPHPAARPPDDRPCTPRFLASTRDAMFGTLSPGRIRNRAFWAMNRSRSLRWRSVHPR